MSMNEKYSSETGVLVGPGDVIAIGGARKCGSCDATLTKKHGLSCNACGSSFNRVVKCTINTPGRVTNAKFPTNIDRAMNGLVGRRGAKESRSPGC